MNAHSALRLAIWIAALVLLVPYGELLFATWSGDSKAAAPSMLAFAAALFLAWRGRGGVRTGAAGSTPAGLVALTLAAAGYALAVVFDVRLIAGLCGVSVLATLLYLDRGWPAVRTMLVPFVLLALATPMPAFVEAEMTRILVAVTVLITPAVLYPIVGAIEVEGAVLHMSAGSVAVVDDCSGLGGVLLFAPLAVVLIAVHGPMPRLRAAALLVAAVGLAFAGSLLRVWISALLVYFESSLADSDTVHEALGIATLLLALGALVVIGGRLAPRPDTKEQVT